MKHDPVGDHLKSLESSTRSTNLAAGWLCARLDGHTFSKVTKGLRRPYDTRLSSAMLATTRDLVDATTAQFGYTQSDEITLLWAPRVAPDEWDFAGRRDKWLSLLAARTTAFFHQHLLTNDLMVTAQKAPHFDCRIIDGLSIQDAFSFLTWRQEDARRNAVQMMAQHHFPKKSLFGQNLGVLKDRLRENGTPFENEPTWFQNGSLLRVTKRNMTPEERLVIPKQHRPSADTLILRRHIETLTHRLPKDIEDVIAQLCPAETQTYVSTDPLSTV